MPSCRVQMARWACQKQTKTPLKYSFKGVLFVLRGLNGFI